MEDYYIKYKSSGLWILIGACITLLATCVWIALFRDYWVIQETRFYYSGENYPTFSPLDFFLIPQGVNSRFVSMFLASVVTKTFGPSAPVVNIIQIIILGLGLFLLFCHSIQITRNLTAAVFALIMTVLSSATANMLLWQATQHDKIVVVFSALALIIHFYIIQRDRISWLQSIILTLALIVTVIVANNSKETAIFIPVALAAQILLFKSLSRYNSDYKVFLPFVLVVIYDLVFWFEYFSHLNPDWQQHIAGGNVFETLLDLIAYFFNTGNFMNLYEWGPAHVWQLRSFGVTAAGLFGLIALIGVRLARLRNNTETFTFDLNARGFLYFLVVGASVLALTARVAYPNAFYILLPQWCFGLLLGLLAASPERNLLLDGRATALVLALLLAGQTIAFSAHFLTGGLARRMLTYSDNLQESAAVIRKLAPAGSTASLQIGYPDGLDSVWYLVMGMNEKVDPFIGANIYGVRSSSAPKILEDDTSSSIEGCVRFDLDAMYHVSAPKECTRL